MSFVQNLIAAVASPILVPVLQQSVIVAGDAGNNDRFGWDQALSNDGNTLAISAFGGGFHDGAVYVYVRSGSPAAYVAQAKIAIPGIAGFGYSVSLSDDGNTLAVGHNAVTNGVYVYTRSGTTWTLQATINPSVTGGNFGTSVRLAASGDRLVVGAPGQTSGTATGAGALFVFNRSGSTWTQAARLLRTSAAQNDGMGTNVTISGDGLYVVGCAKTAAAFNYFAVVFFFNGSTWAQQVLLASPTPPYGVRAALDNTGVYCFINDGSYSGTVANQGQIIVYKRSGTSWAPIFNVIKPDHLGTADYLPLTCSRDGSLVATTFQAPTADQARFGFSALFRAINENWSFCAAPKPAALTGSAVGSYPCLSGDGKTMAIGAPFDNNGSGVLSGVVRVYTTSALL